MATGRDSATFKINWDPQNREWRMAKDMGTARGPGDYPAMTVDYNHDGQLTFDLQNAPAGVTFAQTAPFAPKSGSPPKADFWDQFRIVSGQGERVLVVHDANAKKTGGAYAGGDYEYELRFSNTSVKLDPIIKNGGCCQGQFQHQTALFIGIGVALAVLAFFLYRRFRANRSPVDG